MLRDADRRRFAAKVIAASAGACWRWSGSHFSTGYPAFWLDGQNRGGHRVMFELVHGWSPPLVMHSCDTRGCVNPRHLLPGTPLANQSDMWAKGRGAWGEHHTNHKLTADQVRVMRAAAARGQASVRALAHAHGMTPEGVRAAISGKTWRHLAP